MLEFATIPSHHRAAASPLLHCTVALIAFESVNFKCDSPSKAELSVFINRTESIYYQLAQYMIWIIFKAGGD